MEELSFQQIEEDYKHEGIGFFGGLFLFVVLIELMNTIVLPMFRNLIQPQQPLASNQYQHAAMRK